MSGLKKILSLCNLCSERADLFSGIKSLIYARQFLGWRSHLLFIELPCFWFFLSNWWRLPRYSNLEYLKNFICYSLHARKKNSNNCSPHFDYGIFFHYQINRSEKFGLCDLWRPLTSDEQKECHQKSNASVLCCVIQIKENCYKGITYHDM